MKRFLSYIQILLLLLSTAYSFPQQSKLSKSVNNISEYLASDEFLSLKSSLNDLNVIDSIYTRAVKQEDFDYSEALLSLIFTSIPYREVPIQLPIIKLVLNFPLISASDSIFNLKNENIPRYIFFDTPDNLDGDKDKLAHFFGSAYISFSSHIFDFGKPIGYFVEVFEETFKVQSTIDERDLITNELGYLFGTLLKKNKNIFPSQVIIQRTLTYFNFNI